MRPKKLNFDPANANLIGYASNVTGATWTISTTNSGDSFAHQVSIRNDSATDHSGLTVILTGTDADGRPQTETMALPGSSATVTSTKYFKTLLTAVPSATIGADTMDIGWVDEIASATIPLDHYNQHAVMVGLNVTGTISVTIQLTNDDIYALGKVNTDEPAFEVLDQEALLWIDDDNLAAITVDSHGAISDWPVRAIRLITVSYTDTAEVQMTVTSPY